jgi:hypothetical protein
MLKTASILLTLSTMILAIQNNETIDFNLLKKDFINGELNTERANQIILRDPRLVPKSRGGLKDDIDSLSDGLGVLVIGKILNGSVDSIELKNDNKNFKLNYLVNKYGNEAKSAGMSTIDYLEINFLDDQFNEDEKNKIRDIFTSDGITDVILTSNNNDAKINDIITYSVQTKGNANNSELTYNWSTSSNLNIETNNENSIVVSINGPGTSSVSINVTDPDSEPLNNLLSFVVEDVPGDGSTNKNTTGAIPVLTSNTSSDGIAFSDTIYSISHSAFRAFNRNNYNSWLSDSSSYKGYIGYIFPESKLINKIKMVKDTLKVNKFIIEASSDTTNGTDGNWNLLYESGSVASIAYGVETEYGFVNNTSYKAYRVNVLSSSLGPAGIMQLQFYEDLR